MMTIEEKAKAYDKGVETVAAILNAMAEHKPNIELIQRSWYMEGYHDREFGKEPKWIIKTGEGGPKHELNPRYGQPLADEQKPTECISDSIQFDEGFKTGKEVGFREGVESINSAGWSEEDERMLSRCVKSIESSKRFADSDTFKKAKDKEIDWLTKYLKSLRPQPNTVSVENATKFGNPEYERGIKDGIQHTKNHQWKPSEEQMNALNFAITHFVHYTNYKNLTELRELYDDLLKLL